jgi:hypothetical protein
VEIVQAITAGAPGATAEAAAEAAATTTSHFVL